MKNQNEKDTTNPSIIFLQNIVNGNNHNIINQSHKLKKTYQTNETDLEKELLKKENIFLKNEVEFLKQQLEISQSLFEQILAKNK